MLAGGLVALSSCSTGGSYLRADPDHSGGVSPEEFDSYMKGAIFAHFDSDKTGKVTREEYQRVNPNRPAADFNKTDRNGDGIITRAEADEAFDREGSLTKLFKKIDTDGNGTLSKEEVEVFDAAIKAQPGDDDFEKLKNTAQTS